MSIQEQLSARLRPWLPPRLRDDEDEVRRVGLLLGFSVLLGTFGLGFSAFVWLFTTPTEVTSTTKVTILIGTVISLGNPWLLRRTSKPGLSSLILVLTLLCAMTIAPLSNTGIDDASVWWLIPVPVLAGFLLGRRAAAVFGLVVFFDYWLIYALDPVPFEGGPDPEHTEWWIALCASTAALLISGLAWGYESAREITRRPLEQKLEELEQANAKLAEVSSDEAARRAAAEERDARKQQFLADIAQSAATQGDALGDASSALTQMTESLKSIASNVESLRQAAASSEGAISAVTAGSQAAARTSNEMASSSNNVAEAIYTLATSMRGVTADVGALNQAAQSAVSEMEAMYHASAQVEARTQEARQLAETAQADAARGADAVLEALAGIGLIGTNVQLVQRAVENLNDDVQEIGAVLEVIDEVASQTQLLALNASILASQAGEHGRGFMVVASEIKKLSDRTAVSTEAIGAKVRALAAGAERTATAMVEGNAAVRRAVELSETARAALGTLATSAETSLRTTAAIASAATEGGTRARRMAEAMQQVAATLAEVSSEVGEQAKRSDTMLASTDRMRRLSDEVAMASDDQAEGAQRIELAVTRIHEMVRVIEQTHQEQARGAEFIVNSIEAIHHQQTELLRSVAEMEDD